MKSTSPTISALKEMLSLAEKRESLASQVSDIDAQIARLAAGLGTPAQIPAARKVALVPKVSGRGALKQRILEVLQAADKRGISVSEIASTLGAKPANIHAWFQATGKSIRQIKKVARGLYRLSSEVAAPAAPAAPVATPAAKPTAKPAARSKKTKKRGELKSKILAALNSAGPDGVSLKDLSTKLSTPYKNLSIWFSTTGKKIAGIKKTAPGHYKLTA